MRAPIDRRRFLLWSSELAATAWASTRPAGAAETEVYGTRPNVLWIVLDTARARNFTCYGYHRNTSPNVAQMAAQGVVFESNYSQAFWTAPSVACYMTGRYFPDWVVEPCDHATTIQLATSKGEVLAPAAFRAHGYDTAMFSSHSGYVTPESRLGKAFDESHLARTAAWPSIDPGGRRVKKQTMRELNEGVLPWLRARESMDRPFFLYVHAMDQHSPYVIPKRAPFDQWLLKDYSGRHVINFNVAFDVNREGHVKAQDRDQLQGLYDGTILHADHHLGAIFRALDQTGLADSTIVAVTSDHGESLFEDLRTFSHSARYGRPGADETHHIPLVLRGPGIPRGRRIGGFTESIDLLPTLLDLCGIDAGGWMDGRSLRPLMAQPGTRSTRRFAFTKAEFHDVLGQEPLCNPDVDRVFLRTAIYNCEVNRGFPEKCHAWKAPDNAGDRVEVFGEEKERYLGDARAAFDAHLLPIETAAQEDIPPRVVVFNLGNPRIFHAPKANDVPQRKPGQVHPEAARDTWILEIEEGGEGTVVCFPQLEGEMLHIQVPRMIYGRYRMLVELFAGNDAFGFEGSSIDLRVDGKPYKKLSTTPHEGPGRWEWLDYGPIDIKWYGLNVALKANGKACRIRRVTLYSEVPGALEIVKQRVIRDAALTMKQKDREEALEALGYL